MPPKESRLKSGTLTLGGVAFATQATNVSIKPDYDEQGDQLEVLSGDVLTPDEVGTYSLNITAIQDFDEPDGFVAFSWNNELEVVPYVWEPSGATGPSYSGQVKVKAVEVGGDVNKRLDTQVEWPCEGRPVVVYPA